MLVLIAMLSLSRSQAQVVTDTSRCGNINKKGHLRSLLEGFKNTCLNKTANYNFTDVAFSNSRTISYLNRSFRTKIFNNYCFLEKSSSTIAYQIGEPKVSFAMVEIGFRTKKDKANALAIIRSAHDDYFPGLELMTGFVLLKEEDTIVLVFAEEEFLQHELMRCFFSELKTMKWR